MNIIFSPLAVERIGEIAEYIALDNPDASVKWVDSVFSKVERLKTFPESGRIVPELDNREIREIFFGNYKIIYRYEKGLVSILTVRHGMQILPVDEISYL